MSNKIGGFRSFTTAIAFLLLLFLIFVAGVYYFFFQSNDIFDASLSSDKVAVVRVEGMITNSEETIRQVRKWGKDKSIKALVLRINSPGGAVAPSQEMYNEISKVAKKKPVVASMGTLAASGGYYIAVACNKIMADPGTLTGSIGVIMMFDNFEKLMDKIGMKSLVFKSGQFKDTGSPFREVTEDDKKLIHGIIDSIYTQFITDVAKGRQMDIEEVRKLADGRIYTGQQALDLKLVDELGGMQDAIKVASTLAGIDGEPKVVEEEEEKSFLRYILGEEINSKITERAKLSSGAYFLWPAW